MRKLFLGALALLVLLGPARGAGIPLLNTALTVATTSALRALSTAAAAPVGGSVILLPTGSGNGVLTPFAALIGKCAANSLVDDGVTCLNTTTGDGNSWKAQSAATGHISIFPSIKDAGGAVVNRMADRLFVGKNTNVNDGNSPEIVKDWLETLFNNSTSIANISSLAQLGGIGIIGASRTSDGVVNGYDIGNSGICVNDISATGNTACAGGYFEALKPVGTYGANFAQGVEINVDELNSGTVNGVSYPVFYQPYTSPFPNGLTDALRLASGGARAGAQAATDAIAIINNGGNFNSGIVFQQNAINGTNGLTGFGEAIALAKGHLINWYSPDGNVNSRIVGIGTTGDLSSVVELGKGMLQLFSSGNATLDLLATTGAFSSLVNFSNGTNQYNVGIDGTGANFIITNNGNTGDILSVVANNLTLGQTGTNTNILGAIKAGSAGSWIANGSVATTMTSLGPTNSHTTIQEWLAIVDSAGTVRYIPAY